MDTISATINGCADQILYQMRIIEQDQMDTVKLILGGETWKKI